MDSAVCYYELKELNLSQSRKSFRVELASSVDSAGHLGLILDYLYVANLQVPSQSIIYVLCAEVNTSTLNQAFQPIVTSFLAPETSTEWQLVENHLQTVPINLPSHGLRQLNFSLIDADSHGIDLTDTRLAFKLKFVR